MYEVSLDEASAQLPVLVDAAIRGEEVFITQDGSQVVQLIRVARSPRRPQFGSARGLITMEDDFDEPLTDFDEYMS